MARIIETEQGSRRIIKLSSNDIISVVQSFQQIVPRRSGIEDTRNYLDDIVLYIPEDI